MNRCLLGNRSGLPIFPCSCLDRTRVGTQHIVHVYISVHIFQVCWPLDSWMQNTATSFRLIYVYNFRLRSSFVRKFDLRKTKDKEMRNNIDANIHVRSNILLGAKKNIWKVLRFWATRATYCDLCYFDQRNCFCPSWLVVLKVVVYNRATGCGAHGSLPHRHECHLPGRRWASYLLIWNSTEGSIFF